MMASALPGGRGAIGAALGASIGALASWLVSSAGALANRDGPAAAALHSFTGMQLPHGTAAARRG